MLIRTWILCTLKNTGQKKIEHEGDYVRNQPLGKLKFLHDLPSVGEKENTQLLTNHKFTQFSP